MAIHSSQSASGQGAATPPDRGVYDLLHGSGAADVLAAAAGTNGMTVAEWSLHTFHARPGGAGVSAVYDVTLTAQDSVRATRGFLVVTSSRLRPTERANLVTVANGDTELHVWLHPHDPLLPGLAAATDPRRAHAFLPDEAPVSELEMLTYRPLRRAVVRIRTPGGAYFMKVLRPHKAPDLVARHRAFHASSIEVPACVGMSEDGVVTLSELPGESVVQRVAGALPADQPRAIDPSAIVEGLQQLPRQLCELPRRLAWSERVDLYSLAAAEALPQHREAVARLARHLSAAAEHDRPGDVVASHGDATCANVFLAVGETRLSGLIDLDTAGPGHLVDDLACFTAHLAVLPGMDSEMYAGVSGLVDACMEEFARHVDPPTLRRRAASVVLSLVAGSDHDDRANTWLDMAHELAGIPRA